MTDIGNESELRTMKHLENCQNNYPVMQYLLPASEGDQKSGKVEVVDRKSFQKKMDRYEQGEEEGRIKNDLNILRLGD